MPAVTAAAALPWAPPPPAPSAGGHPCRMCGLVSASHALNVRHMMTHLRAYVCMQCWATFLTASDLQRHVDQHAAGVEKPVVLVDLVSDSSDEASADEGTVIQPQPEEAERERRPDGETLSGPAPCFPPASAEGVASLVVPSAVPEDGDGGRGLPHGPVKPQIRAQPPAGRKRRRGVSRRPWGSLARSRRRYLNQRKRLKVETAGSSPPPVTPAPAVTAASPPPLTPAPPPLVETGVPVPTPIEFTAWRVRPGPASKKRGASSGPMQVGDVSSTVQGPFVKSVTLVRIPTTSEQEDLSSQALAKTRSSPVMKKGPAATSIIPDERAQGFKDKDTKRSRPCPKSKKKIIAFL